MHFCEEQLLKNSQLFHIMIKKIINKFEKFEKFDFSGIFFYLFDLIKTAANIYFFNLIIYQICHLKGVNCGKRIIFNGFPIIKRFPNSSIRFGNNCIFNSARNSVPIQLQNACVFITANKNAEIVFGNNSGASGLKIYAKSKITIGNNVLIGAGCIIMDNDSHNSDPAKRLLKVVPSKPIIIEDNVFIGLQCTILKGVTIGENSVIGANSVVFNSIPENSIALGNPCKVIMKRS